MSFSLGDDLTVLQVVGRGSGWSWQAARRRAYIPTCIYIYICHVCLELHTYIHTCIRLPSLRQNPHLLVCTVVSYVCMIVDEKHACAKICLVTCSCICTCCKRQMYIRKESAKYINHRDCIRFCGIPGILRLHLRNRFFNIPRQKHESIKPRSQKSAYCLRQSKNQKTQIAEPSKTWNEHIPRRSPETNTKTQQRAYLARYSPTSQETAKISEPSQTGNEHIPRGSPERQNSKT